MKRLAITGGNGFVAGSIIRQAGPEWELHVLSRQNAVPAGSQTVWHTVNADNEPQLRSLLDDVRPVALVHLAAIADIDYCQAHPDEARNVNTEMTRSLAQICRDIHCRMVHVSTDTVFDGGRGMYTERDAPGPVNIYGETKAAAEMLVARTAPDWVVARLALVMGLPMLGRGNSFLARMISVLETGESLHVPIREIRTIRVQNRAFSHDHVLSIVRTLDEEATRIVANNSSPTIVKYRVSCANGRAYESESPIILEPGVVEGQFLQMSASLEEATSAHGFSVTLTYGGSGHDEIRVYGTDREWVARLSTLLGDQISSVPSVVTSSGVDGVSGRSLMIRHTRRHNISDKVFAKADVVELATLVSDEAASLAHTSRCAVAFRVQCADNTQHEFSSRACFADGSLIDRKRIHTIDMELRGHDGESEHGIRITLQHTTSPWSTNTSYAEVSGSDEVWVNSVFQRIGDLLNRVEPQDHWVLRYRNVLEPIFSCSVGLLVIMLSLALLRLAGFHFTWPPDKAHPLIIVLSALPLSFSLGSMLLYPRRIIAIFCFRK